MLGGTGYVAISSQYEMQAGTSTSAKGQIRPTATRGRMHATFRASFDARLSSHGRTSMRISFHAFTTLALLASAMPLSAQSRCNEAAVRKLAAVSVTELAAPDLYFNVVAGRSAVVGLPSLDTLRRLHENERRNEQPHVFSIYKVEATSDGSMAWDDGSVHVEFDDSATGKHVAYDLTYLRVWKVVAGKCVTAAMYGRHEEVPAR